MQKTTTLILLLVAGCATNTGIVPMGTGQYVVARQAATGFTGLGTLKAEALREAESFCASKGLAFHVTRMSENEGPYVLGNFPRAEVQFDCQPK